eukprot:scaffold18563_cov132-Cylindrotheca_fusiformis.AAC.3
MDPRTDSHQSTYPLSINLQTSGGRDSKQGLRRASSHPGIAVLYGHLDGKTCAFQPRTNALLILKSWTSTREPFVHLVSYFVKTSGL